MQLDEARQQFIQAWATLGSQWGINRTMASVHALLLLATEPLHAEDIMAALQVSRGNANMNLRELLDWGLVHKVLRPGERREYFVAEKDLWRVARQVASERRRRELEPLLRTLADLRLDADAANSPEGKQFATLTTGIQRLARNTDRALDLLQRMDEGGFFGLFGRRKP